MSQMRDTNQTRQWGAVTIAGAVIALAILPPLVDMVSDVINLIF